LEISEIEEKEVPQASMTEINKVIYIQENDLSLDPKRNELIRGSPK
jgi:hypothetical protein